MTSGRGEAEDVAIQTVTLELRLARDNAAKRFKKKSKK
jgi:hypothetical protein